PGNGRRPATPGPARPPGRPRFAGPGGPADQDRAGTDGPRRGVHGRTAEFRHYSAGSRTMKRAPSTRGWPLAPRGPVRFSTAIEPPWASTICFEIDSPRPEFWPNP